MGYTEDYKGIVGVDENGYPIDENGDIIWEITSIDKQEVMDAYDKALSREAGFKKFRACNNSKRPKKRKKK